MKRIRLKLVTALAFALLLGTMLLPSVASAHTASPSSVRPNDYFVCEMGIDDGNAGGGIFHARGSLVCRTATGYSKAFMSIQAEHCDSFLWGCLWHTKFTMAAQNYGPFSAGQILKLPANGTWTASNVGSGSGLWRAHLYTGVTDADDPNSPVNDDLIGPQVNM